MKILFVAFPGHAHTMRWISQLTDQGWDIHLFPSVNQAPHVELKQVTVHTAKQHQSSQHSADLKFVGRHPYKPFWRYLLVRLLRTLRVLPPAPTPAEALAKTIEAVQPDIIHALELQHAGYLVLEAKRLLKTALPPLIITNWGSDIYLFGQLDAHREKIIDLLRTADYYTCECERDVMLARSLGFVGKVLPVMPNGGGFHLEKLTQLGATIPPSQRRLIILKGYQNWSGRALFALRALELCAERLAGYEVLIYLADKDVQIAAELFAKRTGVTVDCMAWSPHDAMMQKFGAARLYIGVNISDGVSTSMLEALVMGAFPIQANTACADEWLQHGQNGMLVHPEDVEGIAAALRVALADDALVDGAAVQNRKLAQERLDYTRLKAVAVSFYTTVDGDRTKK